MALQFWLGLLPERGFRTHLARTNHTARYGTHLTDHGSQSLLPKQF